MMYPRTALFCLTLLLATVATAQDNLTYQTPPQAIVNLIDAPLTPRVSLSSDGAWLLVQTLATRPTIAELSQPELRLAGLRINPRTNGPSRTTYVTGLLLKRLRDGKEFPVQGLPTNARLSDVAWSPDNAKVAFAHTPETGIELWLADVATAKASRLGTDQLNAALGNPFEWLADSRTLLCRTVPANRGEVPASTNLVPTGPVIQENLGRKAPSRTYQDLLKNPTDERTFDYYATTQLRKVTTDGTSVPLGQPAVIQQATPSPDGQYVLLKTRHRPYSYLVTVGSFPTRVDVLAADGTLFKTITDLPLADNVPTGFDAVPAGQRQHNWRADLPATLYWVEAQDGGDPRQEAAVRDKIFTLDAPFGGAAAELVALPLRFAGVLWGNATLALVEQIRFKDRKQVTLLINPATRTAPAVLYDRSYQDTYADPGNAYLARNATGQYVLKTDGRSLYFIGAGASPEGDRPFVDQLDLTTRKTTRWWRSQAPYYEVPVSVLDLSRKILLTRRESPTENPNFFVRDLVRNKSLLLTNFPNPYALLGGGLRKQVLKYQRPDGVALTANLYLPPGYKKEDGPLPTLMEAYPLEFKDKNNASQVSGSPYEFTRLNWGSPVFWVTQGYAVLEGASVPIVGEGKAEPNDTYVAQLVAGAKAAIDEGARLGVTDPQRVAVMGHSYGAFMTANLLAHSDLFKAGIARSGAYNRTLTPFGFQSEERTYWEAPEVYYEMSPFAFADKLKTPLLLIHGEADNNPGTFPIQTERFYNALKGHGATVRYVTLPAESHGYAARESIMHMLWEMNTWLDKYVKHAPAPAGAK